MDSNWGLAKAPLKLYALRATSPILVFLVVLLVNSMVRGDAKWIVIRRSLCNYGVITIRPTDGQPPASLSAARGLAALRAYLVFFVTIN
jgi:hypothetical protein